MNHKVGIRVSKYVAQAYSQDAKNINTLRENAIDKDMMNISPASRKLDNGEIVLRGYDRVNFHMIFDVKMEDFRCKSRLVAGGHVIDPPSTITYTGLVSQ